MTAKEIRTWIENNAKPAEHRGKTEWQMSVPSADVLMMLNALEKEQPPVGEYVRVDDVLERYPVTGENILQSVPRHNPAAEVLDDAIERIRLIPIETELQRIVRHDALVILKSIRNRMEGGE